MEEASFDNYDVAAGCILRFEITVGAGKVHRGIILVEQLEMAEHGKRLYGITLAETDTGLILVRNEEYDGGFILKLL